MIYKRIIKFKDDSYLYLDIDDHLSTDFKINNLNNNINNLLNIGNDYIFYGNIIDFLVLYNYNRCINFNYFVIKDLNNKVIIFNKYLIDNFILKYINIHKNRLFLIKILLLNIEEYYINEKFSIINENYINKLNFIIKNKLGNNQIVIFTINNKKINNKKIYHNISIDKHLLKFNSKYLYKNNIKIKIRDISKLIGEFGFINYINHYMINKNYIDIFLLNPLNINGLTIKPLIVKGIDNNINLSIIKGFAEGVERYSSMQLTNDKLLHTSKISIIKKFSKDFLGYEIENSKYKQIKNGFKISKIKEIDNNKIILNKSLNIVLPIDFILFSQENKSILDYVGNSNGISVHTNYYDAFLNSYYEIIERDSIILTYYYKLTPYLIELDNLIYKEKINKLEEEYNYTFSFFNLNFDYGVNIVLCIGKNKKNKIPYIFSGAGANLNFIVAFEKALNEVLYLIDISKRNNYEKVVKKEEKRLKKLNIIDTKDHIYYYSLPDSFTDISFLFLDKKSVSFSEMINLKKKNLIKKINFDNLYISNLTTTFGKKNNFFTIKLFSERYIPIWFGKQNNLPIKKIEKRFFNLKYFLVNKKIFNKSIFNKYYNKEKSFLHFLG